MKLSKPRLSETQQLQMRYGLRDPDLPAEEMLSDDERKKLAAAFAAGLAALAENHADDSGDVQPA